MRQTRPPAPVHAMVSVCLLLLSMKIQMRTVVLRDGIISMYRPPDPCAIAISNLKARMKTSAHSHDA
jgi:hypothetical protein